MKLKKERQSNEKARARATEHKAIALHTHTHTLHPILSLSQILSHSKQRGAPPLAVSVRLQQLSRNGPPVEYVTIATGRNLSSRDQNCHSVNTQSQSRQANMG